MAPIAQCVVDEDVVRRWWKQWLRDAGAEPPAELLESLSERSGMIEAAMEEAAQGMVRVLLADLAEP